MHLRFDKDLTTIATRTTPPDSTSGYKLTRRCGTRLANSGHSVVSHDHANIDVATIVNGPPPKLTAPRQHGHHVRHSQPCPETAAKAAAANATTVATVTATATATATAAAATATATATANVTATATATATETETASETETETTTVTANEMETAAVTAPRYVISCHSRHSRQHNSAATPTAINDFTRAIGLSKQK